MDISAYQHMNIRMSTRGKRPLRNLTPRDKVRAIQRIHNGETKASVSRDIGVPESTLRGWCKNEQKLRFMCRQLGTNPEPLGASDTPPEKRLKYEGNGASLKFDGAANLDDYGYNRLSFSATDFAANNAILEKMALNEYIQKTSPSQEAARRSAPLPTAFNQTSVPAEYSQLAMLQNFNLLSLLNTSMAPESALGATTQPQDSKRGIPQRAANGAEDFRSNRSSGGGSGSPALSVKDWAKDPAKKSSPANIAETGALNDSNNNNEVKPRAQQPTTAFPEAAFFPNMFPAYPPPILPPAEDSDSSSAALMDWCKLFNASLQYLALSAAAAALQQPGATGLAFNEELEAAERRARPADNILYKQLTKDAGSHAAGSDASNDSYFDSEPEDLSVPSTHSKLSSPTCSRSQSPTVVSSSSAHSNAD